MKPKESKKDYYHNLAKKEGYRARSAYKLIQLDEKYKFISKKKTFLDLGAAPGSWSQAIIKLNPKAKVVAIDYKRIKEIDGVISIKSDIFADDLMEQLKRYFPKGVDVILSDMAPKLSGDKNLDSAQTISLVERAFNFSLDLLKEGGFFIAKYFQCRDALELKRTLSRYFAKCFTTKPSASRKGNSEMYFVCKNFRRNKGVSQ